MLANHFEEVEGHVTLKWGESAHCDFVVEKFGGSWRRTKTTASFKTSLDWLEKFDVILSHDCESDVKALDVTMSVGDWKIESEGKVKFEVIPALDLLVDLRLRTPYMEQIGVMTSHRYDGR